MYDASFFLLGNNGDKWRYSSPFSHSLLFLLTHTDTDGLVSAGVTHDPFLCTEVKETSLHDESQNIPEAFTLVPVGAVKNKCVVCFF